MIRTKNDHIWLNSTQGRIPDFKLGGGAHLKNLRRAERGAKICGVFRVKNHDFTPKNYIFSILWGAWCAPPGSVPGASIQKLINIDRRKCWY